MISWGENSIVAFYGCNTATFTKKNGKSQRGKEVGQSGYASFPRNPFIHIPIKENVREGKIYLTNFNIFNLFNINWL